LEFLVDFVEIFYCRSTSNPNEIKAAVTDDWLDKFELILMTWQCISEESSTPRTWVHLLLFALRVLELQMSTRHRLTLER